MAQGPTDLLPFAPKEFRFQRFRLEVVEGPDRGLEHVAQASELTVGTEPANDLVLRDPTVSRHHLALAVTPTGVVARDLDSTNGTTLAGYRIGWAYLEPGAILGVGATRLRFELLGDLVREPLDDEVRFGRLLGRSVAMRRVFALARRIAAVDSTVLINGETGTGKELLAEALHEAGPRASGPFVVVDCGALPPQLIESELFGHERGAFTNALTSRPGVLEQSDGGTAFLDEIGELPLDLQPKLLRVLETRTVRRVGGSQARTLDTRIVAATNRDLRQMVNRGSFRSDLYFRLNVVRLSVPPLRDRRDDIPLLAAAFYEELAEVPDAVPPPELIDRLAAHDWPGNVRELRNAIERAVTMGDPETWRELGGGADRDGPPTESELFAFDPALSFRVSKERAMELWERWYVSELVARSGGNLSQAARSARMDRAHLRKLLRRSRPS